MCEASISDIEYDYVTKSINHTRDESGLLILVVNVQRPSTKPWAFGARISFPRGTGLRSGTEMSE